MGLQFGNTAAELVKRDEARAARPMRKLHEKLARKDKQIAALKAYISQLEREKYAINFGKT